MLILAINGSPSGQLGNTDLVLQNLLKGMESAGATTETIYLNKLNIKHCIGCFNCWFKTPGKCIHNDDMAQLLEKRTKADLIIFATPLYVYSMTGLMKDFLDRCLPLAMPFFTEDQTGKSTVHPKRHPRTAPQKMLLVSSCGFPEEKHFAPLVHTFKYIAEQTNSIYLGEVLKTTPFLLKEASMADKAAAYYKNLNLAGKQLILQEKIDSGLLDELSKSWIPNDKLRLVVNEYFHKMLNKQIT